jgi:chemotaxis response regulator CheB
MTPIRVLIIDDSAVMRTILSRVLTTCSDCQVVGFSEGAEKGRVAISELQPDVVTLDISMPGVDGLDYLNELRTMLHPALVVVSASTTPGSVAAMEALARGADACFDKSRIVSHSDQFVETLKAAIRNREQVAAQDGGPSHKATSRGNRQL